MFRQEINLYPPELHKHREWVDFNNMLRVAAGFAALLVLVSAFEYWQLSRLNSRAAARQQELAAVVDEVSGLIDSYGAQSEDPQLTQAVRQLEDNLRGKRILLEFLQGSNLGNAQGMSPYLEDLARYAIAGLQLTAVELGGGGRSVLLSGHVIRAENVPLFLQNLSQGRSFAGKSFETLKIEDTDATGVLSFDVITTGGGE